MVTEIEIKAPLLGSSKCCQRTPEGIERRRIQNRERNKRRGWNGGSWVSKRVRVAIYLRDGLACVYCGRGVEDGATLSLDHVVCKSKGGSNEPGNLVTSCTICNSSRCDRPLRTFCRVVAEYRNVETWEAIEKRVRKAIKRGLDLRGASEVIKRRNANA